MSTLTKVFVVLTAVLSIALSCLFISAAAQWDNWRDLALKNQTKSEAAQTQAQSMSASMQAALALKDEVIADQARSLKDARDEIQSLKDRNTKLFSDLSKAENERLAFEAGRAKLQEILDVTTGELKSTQKQNQTLASQNIDLQSRNARQNSRILELTTNVTIQQDQIRNMQEKLYACEQENIKLAQGQTRGTVAQATPAAPTGAVAVAPSVTGEIRGEIQEIDGVYATVNVGESSGVSIGMTFMVYRAGGAYLGDLVIEQIRPGQAAGKLTTVAEDGIRKGDAVVYGLN